MAFNDGVKVGPIAYIGLVSVLVTFALVLLLQVLYFQQRKSIDDANLAEAGPPTQLTEVTSKQQNALTQRGYVDQERGVVSIGISRAKELVLKDLADGKSPKQVIGPKRPAAKQPAESGQDPVVEEGDAGKKEVGDDSPPAEQENKDAEKS